MLFHCFKHPPPPLPPLQKEDEDAVVETDTARLEEIADAPTGLRDRDLRSMKDQLLVETADVLGVSLFNAELLLRKHGQTILWFVLCAPITPRWKVLWS